VLALPLALSYTGFFLNLFNLVPIRPLDGGRVAQIFSKRAWIVGGILLAAMFLVTMAPQLVLIGVMALSNSLRRPAGVAGEPPPAEPEERSRWSYRYFGLCFFLGASIYFTHRLLHPAGS
jgi:Zn-dependent protease